MPPDTAVAVPEPASLPSVRKPPAEAIRQLERVVLEGNLATLTEGERVAYYARVCESLGLNPLTRPFEYITLNSKLTLYVRKDATDQLRDLHGVTIDRLERERADDLAIVTAYARDRYGRTDSSIGAVSIKGLGGEALANALMKAETKAKRRVTLSICGLGWMDEIEAQDARAVEVAPRAQLSSAIASRTAALRAVSTGESEASPVLAGEAVPVEPSTEGSAGGSPARRRRKASKPPLGPGDAGYGTARAHALAAERGLDHAAVHRIAADVLHVDEGDLAAFSVKDLTEADWTPVLEALAAAPVAEEAVEAFAGRAALDAGLGSGDDPWSEADAAAAEMFDVEADQLTPAQWREFGIRIAHRTA